MTAFNLEIDIVNRALQHCRMQRIGSLTENSPNAREMASIYDAIRRAELRRNTWRFATRRVALRAIDTKTVRLVPDTYAAGTTYSVGAIVQYPASSGAYWISLAASNLGNTPGTPSTYGAVYWDQYFGPLTLAPFDDDITYYRGELVYIVDISDGTYDIYESLVDNNDSDPTDVDEWSEDNRYDSGAVVSYNGTNYQSLIAFNIGNQPDTATSQWTSTVTNPAVSGSWLAISATLSSVNIVYPLTSGPSSQSASRNAFRLPSGYLREAPQTKTGRASWLGAPSGVQYNDWEFEGNYIVSSEPTIILFRFVTDMIDVTKMDDMFCEGLAARLALEAGPLLVPGKWTEYEPWVKGRYKEIMGEARTVNGIETGAADPPVDDYIRVRL